MKCLLAYMMTRGPCNEDVLRTVDPITGCQTNDDVSIGATGLPIVDVFDTCLEAQLGLPEQAR